MTDDEFLADFGHFAESPGGVARLRSLVLNLAVRGRLTSRQVEDGSSEALLHHLTEARSRLVDDKLIRNVGELALRDPARFEENIPAEWVTAPIGLVTEECRRGRGPAYDGGTTPVLNQKCVRSRAEIDLSHVKLTNEEAKPIPGWALLQQGDIVINSTGSGTAGRVAWLTDTPDRLTLDSHVTLVRPIEALRTGFLGVVLHAIEPQLVRMATGTTNQQELGASLLKGLLVPLPPVAEQLRIVERVEALLALCDRLNEAQVRGRGLRLSAARSALASVVSTKRSEPDRALELINEHVALTLSPGEGVDEVVSDLRAAILDLAVRGRLVAQNPTEESPEPTLDAVAELRSGRALPLRTVEPDEQPYEIPPGWVWTRLGFPLDFVNGRAFKSTEWGETGLRIIRIQNITDPSAPADRFDGEVDPKHVIETGDLLLSWSGTLRASIWPAERAVLNQHIFNVRPIADALSVSYALIGLSALINEMTSKTQGSAMQHITKAKLVKIPIPIPPIAEQERIVKRVDELMAICDSLEAALLTERRLATEFAESVVSDLVEQAA